MKRGTRVFLMTFIVTVLIIVLLVGGVFAISFFGLFGSDTFDVDMINLNLSTTVYYTDAKGVSHELTHLYQSQNRIWVDITNVPEYMSDAFIAIEDERFEKHGGVDIPRTAKATLTYLFKGSSSFGGSTITQQLVKNLTDDRDTSPLRKVREMARAIALERELSKEQIMEMYLNTIFLANNCYGVQAASNKYFGLDVSELSLAQCASIAGITQYPSYYDPLRNPENNLEKQRTILDKMYELGKITTEEYEEAINEKIDFGNSANRENAPIQSYFVDEVINNIIQDLQTEKGYSQTLAEQVVYNGGLKVYATIDPNVQDAMENVYENTAHFPAGHGSIRPESAMVIIDNETGAVKGIVGGIGKKKQNRIFNRATQALRQPGSTMKPLGAYGPAIEKGQISPSSLVLDAAIDINGWKPTNYYDGFKGTVTVRTALKESMNTPAVRVLQDVGVDYSYKFVTEKLGISTLVDKDVRNGQTLTDRNMSSLALGGVTDGVKAIEMAAAYAAFANGGIYTEPYTYTKVVDNKGQVLLEKKPKSHVAMSDTTAYMVTSMLQSVVTNGTGTTAKLPCGMPSGGKTGTTDAEKDRWYIGFTPYYTGVVWYGYDTPKPLNFLTAHPCTPVWKNVMNVISAKQTIKSFAKPKSISEVAVCTHSGLQPGIGCQTTFECFKSGKVPTAKCSGIHDTFLPTSPLPDGYDPWVPTIPAPEDEPAVMPPPQQEEPLIPVPTPTPTPETPNDPTQYPDGI